jgi:hypothetical protein
LRAQRAENTNEHHKSARTTYEEQFKREDELTSQEQSLPTADFETRQHRAGRIVDVRERRQAKHSDERRALIIDQELVQ